MRRKTTNHQQINPKDLTGITRVPLHLNPATASAHQSLAHLDGSLKYGPYNWREQGVRVSIYVAAAKRHLDKFFDGEDCDPSSGAHHLGHAMACCAIILDSLEVNNLIDDRPDKAPTGLLMEWLSYLVRRRLAREEGEGEEGGAEENRKNTT